MALYAGLFAGPPTVLKPDYAKRRLGDPRVHFAISTHSAAPGLHHRGIQVEADEGSAVLEGRLGRWGAPVVAGGVGECCYAQSDKVWVFDPQGIPWEALRTMGEAQVFAGAYASRSCCVPTVVALPGSRGST